MSLDEPSARRVVLVQAIESTDADGRLISHGERSEIDQALRAALPDDSQDGPAVLEALLAQRAERVLAQVEERQPALAALQRAPAWQRGLLTGLPVLTLLLGLLTDRIADPHKVDLLSQPLLAILLWNLLTYAVLLASALRGHGKSGATGDAAGSGSGSSGNRPGMLEGLRRWVDGLAIPRRRAGKLRADATRLFLRQWHQSSAALGRWRISRMLHLAAAGWAAGVALSLIARGAFVEYQVGWESTWFDAAQVHAFLNVLLMPAVALLGVAPLSMQEVAQLELGRNSVPEVARRWVVLYATLLLLVVIVPRLLLAGFARWRERNHARSVALDLDQPYFQALAGLLRPARIRLGLHASDPADRQAVLRILLQQRDAPSASASEWSDAAVVLMTVGEGDQLLLDELRGAEPLLLEPPPGPASRGGLIALARGALTASRRAARGGVQPGAAVRPAFALRPPPDVVLQVVSRGEHLAATPGLQQQLGRPLLLLVRPAPAEPGADDLAELCRQALSGSAGDVLRFQDVAACWVQEDLIFDAVARQLPAEKSPGFGRLRAAWARRHRHRFEQAMSTLALQLRDAARETQEVNAPAMSLRDILPAERRAGEQARRAAIAQVVGRLQAAAALTLARLLELHGIDGREARPLELRLEEKFVVHGAVNTPQAGMAGAATGAAMGASVDLMVGGLTLGAAAALGALVGGGAASVAAAWKNKSTGAVVSTVALSAEMLEGLTEAALLRYLAVVHFGRPAFGADSAQVELRWKSDVVAVVQAHRQRLEALWSALRAAPAAAGSDSAAPLAGLLERMAGEVLQRLYPDRVSVTGSGSPGGMPG